MFDAEKIKRRIEDVALREAGLSTEFAHDVAFHMTDWLDDFKELLQFYQDPEAPSSEDVSKLLIQFLVHVPNHLAAAAKLYTGFGVTDVFDVGATSEDDS